MSPHRRGDCVFPYITRLLRKIKSDASQILQEERPECDAEYSDLLVTEIRQLFNNLLAAPDNTYVVDRHTFAELHWAQDIVQLPKTQFFSLLTKCRAGFILRRSSMERVVRKFVAELAWKSDADTIIFYIDLLFDTRSSDLAQIAKSEKLHQTLTCRLMQSQEHQMSAADIKRVQLKLGLKQNIVGPDIYTFNTVLILECEASEITMLIDMYVLLLIETNQWTQLYSSVLLENVFCCCYSGPYVELFAHLIDISPEPDSDLILVLLGIKADFNVFSIQISDRIFSALSFAVKDAQRDYLQKFLFIIEELVLFMSVLDTKLQSRFQLICSWSKCLLPELCDHFMTKASCSKYGIDRQLVSEFIGVLSLYSPEGRRIKIAATHTELLALRSRGLF